MAAAGPGPMPPSRTIRPSANVTSSVPCCSFEPTRSASRTMRGNSGNTASTVSDETEINSGMGDPSNGDFIRTNTFSRPASLLTAGGQCRRSIIATFCSRQAGIDGGVLTRHQTSALDPETQRLPVNSGDDFQRHQRQAKERAQQLNIVERAAAAIKGCGEQRATPIGRQNAQLDVLPRLHHPKMV